MRALVTNDDGIDSPGLVTLAAIAHARGWGVTVVAPAWDASGASASLTAVEVDGLLEFSARSLPSLADTPAFAVEAAPAYIARAAISGAFGPPPDIVLSGVNTGPNTGRAILHSGTVGAALTAASLDVCACAVSINVDSHTATRHWETVARPVNAVLEQLEADPRPCAINVNVPNVEPHEVRGMRHATLASFGAVQTNVTETNVGSVRIEYTAIDPHHEPDSDAALLAQGFVTLSALQPVCQTVDAAWSEIVSALADDAR